MTTRSVLIAACVASISPLAGAETPELVVGTITDGATLQPPAEAAPAAQPEAAPAEQSWLKGWTGSVAAGLNGSDGNTERLNVRAGLEAKRDAAKYETSFATVFSYATENGDETENKWRNTLRNDWKFKDSKWRFFVLAGAETDTFQDWDWRVSVFAGPSYEWIKNDKTKVVLLAGAGLTREIGGSDNDWKPEALVGFDLEHKISDRQKITVGAVLLPELKDAGPYRANAKATYEILVDPEMKMSLKLGIEDRYDSTPGDGFKRNDIDYFAVLSWAF